MAFFRHCPISFMEGKREAT